MKLKKLLILLVSMTCCLCVGAACSTGDDSSSGSGNISSDTGSSSDDTTEVKLLVTELALKVGDTYKLKTDDGVVYDTYLSDNTEVCSVSVQGTITANAVGTAVISVETQSGTLTCTVTVTAKEEDKTDEKPTYSITLPESRQIKVGDECVLTAEIYKDGVLCEETPEWTLPTDSNILDCTENGSQVALKAVAKGEIVISVSFGGVTASCTVKVYMQSSLAAPQMTITSEKLSWTTVENAIGYLVTTDGGATWTEVNDATEYALSNVNPLNVGVIAVAEENSDYVNSAWARTLYQIPENVLKAACEEYGTFTATEGVYAIEGMQDTDFGKKLFYVYGDDAALYDNKGEASFFENTAIVFDVKADSEGTVTFISESSDGKKAISKFNVGSDWATIGYMLNAYTDKCYVVSDVAISVKGVSLQNSPLEFMYSSVYLETLEAFEDIDNAENVAKIKQNYQYLSEAEKELVAALITEENLSAFADVMFLGSVVDIADFGVHSLDGTTQEGTVALTSTGEWIDANNLTGIAVTPTAAYPHIYYADLLPENDPGYDYYTWRLWSGIATTAQVGTKTVDLEKGWNTVALTWSELKASDSKLCRIYVYALPINTISFGIGSLVGCDIESDVMFLGNIANAEDFGVHSLDGTTEEGTVSLTSTGEWVDFDKMSGLAVTPTASYPHIYYTNLLPENDPGYSYYKWRLWSSIATTAQVGTKSVSLDKGWNTVALTWSELKGEDSKTWRIYVHALPTNTVAFGIGSLLGCDADITFLGTTITKENLVAHALNDPATSEGSLTAVELAGTLADSETTATIGYRLTAKQGAHLYYDALMPETDPGYDYYEWKFYNGYGSASIMIEIGGTKFALLPGQWNTVTLAWEQLNENGYIYFETEPASVVVIGSLTGFTKAADITFLGTTMTKENLVAHALNDPTTSEGTLSPVDLTGELADSGTTATVGYRLTAKQWAHLYYDALMPAENPRYDYYEWRIYNGYPSTDITIEIGGTQFTLKAGQWNTVTLTWAQLNQNGKRIYFYTDPASEVVIGSLTGHYYE